MCDNRRHLALDMGTVCCAPLPRPANRPSPQQPSPNIGQEQQQQQQVKVTTTNKQFQSKSISNPRHTENKLMIKSMTFLIGHSRSGAKHGLYKMGEEKGLKGKKKIKNPLHYATSVGRIWLIRLLCSRNHRWWLESFSFFDRPAAWKDGRGIYSERASFLINKRRDFSSFIICIFFFFLLLCQFSKFDSFASLENFSCRFIMNAHSLLIT